MKPHIHHDAIVAWAGGAHIQHRPRGGLIWVDCIHVPEWHITHEYRAAPDYPASSMTTPELREAATAAAQAAPSHADYQSVVYRGVADAALRHACDKGEVVRREEFDRATAAREARDMTVAIAVRDALSSAVIGELFGTSIKYEAAVRMAVEGVKLSDVIASVEVKS